MAPKLPFPHDRRTASLPQGVLSPLAPGMLGKHLPLNCPPSPCLFEKRQDAHISFLFFSSPFGYLLFVPQGQQTSAGVREQESVWRRGRGERQEGGTKSTWQVEGILSLGYVLFVCFRFLKSVVHRLGTPWSFASNNEKINISSNCECRQNLSVFRSTCDFVTNMS